ncbi:LOW QUALITY PROTEIN: hypothetical protein RJ640_026655 [Escallonia rubra]|uniref:Protein kinase domain-containing protein n=1 Tax=Escallonia rubra TaxID=112253 RepID=A0AA88QMW5_9ASTE|nr:LOW QUALITY PROTEIN: hypothetical protein RJ640_026655 [Escallonia rubra]
MLLPNVVARRRNLGMVLGTCNIHIPIILAIFRMSLTPKRYCYTDVKKMTNSFKIKLGYGCVYRGELSNGGLVAVKVLNDSKSNGEDFINEVASISQTSHVNIVTLLGFCFEGRKIALIYDFMPNGSLEKFIYDRSLSTNRLLGWEKLYHIAIAIT